ncbi:hypothetical protein J6590_067268 [Homalodisca vitripennis]|nr:hypothetical protein J6590_067268 [Homalodisca vitripennis]
MWETSHLPSLVLKYQEKILCVREGLRGILPISVSIVPGHNLNEDKDALLLACVMGSLCSEEKGMW